MDWSRIKLYRKIEERERYKDANTARLFFHCLIKANYEEKKWQWITIKKWSFVTSIDSLCFQLKLTKSCVETALKKLQKSWEIKKQIGSKYTLLEIVNRQDYQEDKKQIGNKSETNKKQIGTTKEVKNIRTKEYKNKEEEKEKQTKFAPPSLLEVQTYISEKNYSVNPERFIAYYESIGWMVWKNKMKNRKATISSRESRQNEEKKKKTNTTDRNKTFNFLE